ncbi:hypothetical protein [Streptomyces exfoliatus]|uniref:hypothetical protein n=1 Tax=Streptomyces exfoliatus TaxID=1905 RepID=UPI0004CB94FA|nr:hypothetical protein [Streptomyces exfoliatus]
MNPLHTQHGMPESEAAAEARRLLDNWASKPAFHPTSFRDDTALPAFGTTPPVPQPDHRIVPAWAAGIAVASIGVGAGITGIGCGAWLVLQGLSSVTLAGVLMVTLPFAGLAMAATAIGGAISKTRAAITHNEHHYTGTVTQHVQHVQHVQHTQQTARGLLGRITNR